MDAKIAQLAASFPLAATTFLITTSLGLLYLLYRKALPQPIPGIPYNADAGKSIFGDIPSMISYTKQTGNALPWMFGLNVKHKAPLVQFFSLPFTKPILVLSDFQETQDVLQRRTKEFDRAKRSLDGFAGIMPHHHISMKSTDPRFKGNKELVRDLMSPNFLLEVAAPQIHAKTLFLIDLWSFKADAAGERPFEAFQDISEAAMDIVQAAAFTFGDELALIKPQFDLLSSQGAGDFKVNDNGSVEFPRPTPSPEIVTVKSVISFLGDQVNSPFPKLTLLYRTLTSAKLRRDLAEKNVLIRKFIKRSLDKLQDGDETMLSATDYILQRERSVAKKEGRQPDYFSARAVDELFGYIIGGHETTATSLSWIFKLISDHQDVQDKLRETLRAAFPAALAESRQPTAHEIARSTVPYLDAVIEECLRVGRPTPMVAREATVDTQLLGHHIPKGALLLLGSGGPGYSSPAFEVDEAARTESSRAHTCGRWEDPSEFDPERWLKREKEKGGSGGEVSYDPSAGPILTFSLGPRGCFGRRLAYMELRLVVSLLIWNFRFRKLEGELASYETWESVTVMPKFCYMGLERV
ncbi:cytochrome P450 [Xylariales sp. PMI_506]|nr:cytochrome P450 [Xylariales sp. PMI_506]